MNKSWVFVCMACLCLWVGVCEGQEMGNFFVENFKAKKDYEGHTQNWTCLQSPTGLLYIGNNEGLIEYDGAKFTNVESQGILRSLAIDKNGVLYAGFKGEFGYFKPNEQGKLIYQSLSAQIAKQDEKLKDFGNVWKVFVIGNALYFCAFEGIFKYQHFKLQKIIKPQKRFFVAFAIDNKIYLSENNRGILTIEQDTVRVLKNTAFIVDNNNVYNIFEHKGKIAIGTRTKGFYLVDAKTEEVNKLTLEADTLLGRKKFIPIRKTSTGDWLVGTVEGMVITDSEGKFKESIDNTTGLNDNTVWDIHIDKEQQVWAALNSGLAHINLNASLSYWNATSGIADSKVYCVSRFQGTIYIGTSQGVFYIEGKRAKKVQGSENQVWQFAHLFPNTPQEKLLYVSNDGIHEIKNRAISNSYSLTSCYTILQPFKQTNLFYVGNRDSLYIFEYAQPKLLLKDKVKNLKGEFRQLIADEKGNVLAEIATKGIAYLHQINPTTLQPEYTKVIEQQLNAKQTDLGIICREKEFLMFNKNKPFILVSDTLLKAANSSYDIKEPNYSVSHMATDKQNNLWMAGIIAKGENEELLLGYFDTNNSFHYKEFLQMPNTEINAIYPDSAGIVWFGTSDGLFRYDSKIENNYNLGFQTLLRRVKISKDSTIFYGHYFINTSQNKQDILDFQVVNQQPKNFIPSLVYTDNEITFDFAATFFESHHQTEYSHYLEGYDNNWSAWTKLTQKEYTNLSEGNYTFRVKAKNVYEVEGKEATYQFTILPPWYRTWWAYLTYVCVAVLAIYWIVKLNTARLQAQNAALEQTVAERTAQIAAQKQEVENSYENVQVLSEIGKQITASLELDKVLTTLYENVNQLMDATVFGIGLYDEEKQTIYYQLAVENGIRYTPFSRTMADKNQFPVWCIEQKSDVLIANVFTDYQNYIAHYHDDAEKVSLEDGSLTNKVYSMIYTPILSGQQVLGVITVQSYQPNAYMSYHLNLLKSLAIYTQIALKNADTFHEIEQQKQEILASINYAKRIQNAMLPTTETLNNLIGSNNYFTLFKPRDIVSGDFYWCKEINEKLLFVVADCTGHGVPGAFVSMVGNAALNEITRRGLSHPYLILNKLNKEITAFFNQQNDNVDAEIKVQDGMDICMIAIDKANQKIYYAGAMNPLYYVQHGELKEIKADKRAIGGSKMISHASTTLDFTNHEIALVPDLTFYLCSDGYQDQFGGSQNKKFMSKKLRELLLSISNLPLTEQQKILDKTITEWIGNGEQTDDITVAGLRV